MVPWLSSFTSQPFRISFLDSPSYAGLRLLACGPLQTFQLKLSKRDISHSSGSFPSALPLQVTSDASSVFIHPSRPTPAFSRPQPSTTPPLLFTSSSGEAERFTPCGWDSLAALIVAETPTGNAEPTRRSPQPQRQQPAVRHQPKERHSTTQSLSGSSPPLSSPPRALSTPEHSGSCSFLVHHIPPEQRGRRVD